MGGHCTESNKFLVIYKYDCLELICSLVLLGPVGGRYAVHEQPGFAAGAMTASLLWFSLLDYGASRLSGWFRKPAVWKGIEALTGAIMLFLAAGLVRGIG